MDTSIKPDTWVWIVVQDPGGNEQFLGQTDKEENLDFIPTFLQKEDAQQCFPQMLKEKGRKYEIQAILFEELASDAAKHEFMIFMLNTDGEIIEKIKP